MALIDDVKTALRISHTKLDADIALSILACKTDLSMSGVHVVEESDPLTEQAIKLYCRYFYNYNGQSERWERAYDSIKQSMALCGDYNTEATTP